MSYMTISSQEKALFKKRIPPRHLFFYSVRPFAPIPQHYFSKYWGGPMHGPFPHLKFWGDRPPSPPSVSAPENTVCFMLKQIFIQYISVFNKIFQTQCHYVGLCVVCFCPMEPWHTI